MNQIKLVPGIQDRFAGGVVRHPVTTPLQIDLGGGGSVQCGAYGPFIGLSKRFWNFSNISSNAQDKLIVI
jgi:hypothetical protein